MDTKRHKSTGRLHALNVYIIESLFLALSWFFLFFFLFFFCFFFYLEFTVEQGARSFPRIMAWNFLHFRLGFQQFSFLGHEFANGRWDSFNVFLHRILMHANTLGCLESNVSFELKYGCSYERVFFEKMRDKILLWQEKSF